MFIRPDESTHISVIAPNGESMEFVIPKGSAIRMPDETEILSRTTIPEGEEALWQQS